MKTVSLPLMGVDIRRIKKLVEAASLPAKSKARINNTLEILLTALTEEKSCSKVVPERR